MQTSTHRFSSVLGTAAGAPPAPYIELEQGWRRWRIALVEPRHRVGRISHDGASTAVWFFDRSLNDTEPGQFIAAFGPSALLAARARIQRNGLILDGAERQYKLTSEAAVSVLLWLDATRGSGVRAMVVDTAGLRATP
jgi:hypothetical protein